MEQQPNIQIVKPAAIKRPQGIDFAALNKVLLTGDLSGLNAEEKTSYYNKVCETVGLNPLTKPFEYIKFQGKEVLYAGKNCAEQLREIHGISITIISREMVGDLLVVTARATSRDGRQDESIGALTVKGLGGLDLANAMMKTETKAKRRVTLSICGLGMLDETEVADIPKEGTGLPPIPAPGAVLEIDQRSEFEKRKAAATYVYCLAGMPDEHKTVAERALNDKGAAFDTEDNCWYSAHEFKRLVNYLRKNEEVIA